MRRWLTLVAVVLLGPALGQAQQPAAPISEVEVHAIAAQLRCVVCQNLSVADSPSEMAGQMRGVIRERLAAGERPDQVIRYFVDKYGEWILLAPPRRGFTLLVWVVPPLAVAVGIVLVVALVTRWTRRAPTVTATGGAVDARMRERIRREMEREA
jgi:cytochrome c-type biogenesis protein CcmH